MRKLSLGLSLWLIGAMAHTPAASSGEGLQASKFFTVTSTSITDGARIPMRFGRARWCFA